MPEAARFALLPRLGIEPTVQALVAEALDEAITACRGPLARRKSSPWMPVAGASPPCAGSGRGSGGWSGPTSTNRRSHSPHLDEFAIVDLCGPADAFAAGDVRRRPVELHARALRRARGGPREPPRWLRPGGTLVATTVNRRHPFVAAYLGLPAGPRHAIQPLIKASAADAHPLVGACNDPATVRRTLDEAGFVDIRMRTVGHLARAWGRHLPTFAIGLAGDLLTSQMPSRRSTIVAVATAPSA